MSAPTFCVIFYFNVPSNGQTRASLILSIYSMLVSEVDFFPCYFKSLSSCEFAFSCSLSVFLLRSYFSCGFLRVLHVVNLSIKCTVISPSLCYLFKKFLHIYFFIFKISYIILFLIYALKKVHKV